MVKTTIYSPWCWNPVQLQPFSQSRWYGFCVVNHIPKRRCLSFPGRLFVNMAHFQQKGYGLKEESYEVLLGEHLRSLLKLYMDVSENSGTPKSSILIGFSIISHSFWGTTIFGNAYIKPWILSLKGITFHPKIPQLNSKAELKAFPSPATSSCTATERHTPEKDKGAMSSSADLWTTCRNLEKLKRLFEIKVLGGTLGVKSWIFIQNRVLTEMNLKKYSTSDVSFSLPHLFWRMCLFLVNNAKSWYTSNADMTQSTTDIVTLSVSMASRGIPSETFGQWTTPTDRLWHLIGANVHSSTCHGGFFVQSLKLMQSQRLIDETLVVGSPTPLKTRQL